MIAVRIQAKSIWL